MDFKTYKALIRSDFYRITGTVKMRSLIRAVFMCTSYKYPFWMRTCCYTHSNPLLKYTLYPPAKIILNHLKFKLGLSIPFTTKIGYGFYVGHFGGIVINHHSRIGNNCNISQGVTLGESSRGKNKGFPVIGNNVYIGPGAKIIGAVKIGNNVAIGANCVVTKDVPDNSVVVGIPGKVISDKGATDYVIRTDYNDKINL